MITSYIILLFSNLLSIVVHAIMGCPFPHISFFLLPNRFFVLLAENAFCFVFLNSWFFYALIAFKVSINDKNESFWIFFFLHLVFNKMFFVSLQYFFYVFAKSEVTKMFFLNPLKKLLLFLLNTFKVVIFNYIIYTNIHYEYKKNYK